MDLTRRTFADTLAFAKKSPDTVITAVCLDPESRGTIEISVTYYNPKTVEQLENELSQRTAQLDDAAREIQELREKIGNMQMKNNELARRIAQRNEHGYR